jgi:hypothetical protein
MDDQNKKYKILVSKLKSSGPSISNPDQLTDSILLRIQETETESRKSRAILWFRAISTAAAILFLGLYILQATENHSTTATNNASKLLSIKLLKTNFCDNLPNSIPENKNELIAQYICYMQKNTTENKIFNQYFQKQNPDCKLSTLR